jgi:hypothetical protein
MKKAVPKEAEMLREYDFSNGVRGKYAARYAKGTNVVVIDEDLTAKFPNSRSVNQALRRLLEIAPARPSRGASKDA